MQRRSFLAGLITLPFFSSKVRGHELTKPVDLSKWTDVIFVGGHPNGRWIKDPFIKVDLNNGPVTVDGLTFSTSDLMSVRLSYGNEPTVRPSKSAIEKLRTIMKTNGGETIEIVWGPEILPDWVSIKSESGLSYLITIVEGGHSKSDFINTLAKNIPRKFTNNTSPWVKQGIYDLMTSDAKFYHIVKGNQSNLWATGIRS